MEIKSESGFTLIEVLLAIVIIGIISVCIFSAFSASLRLGEKLISKSGLMSFLKTTEKISYEMENSVKFDHTASFPDWVSLSGTNSQLMFITIVNDGIKQIKYRIEKEKQIEGRKQQFQLVKSESDLLGANKQATESVIVKNLTEGEFKFFYGNRNDDTAAGIDWKNEWQDVVPPDGVKIEFVIDGEKYENIVNIPTKISFLDTK